MASELFVMRDGRMIVDESLSEKLFLIKEKRPETFSETDSGYEWNEMGMSELFGELYRGEARYCKEQKTWYVYTGGRWYKDEGSVIVSGKLKDFCRLMLLYAADIIDETLQKKYYSFISSLGDRRIRDRILKDAADVLAISMTEFDTDPYLINCRNGTYDLRTFEFREHDPEDLITMQTAFDHTVSRDVSCARWERFVSEVTEGDEVKAEYLQRALGYSMLGRSNEECMFILHGKTTRNGKSTMIHTIEHLLGDYGTATPVGLICRTDKSRDSEAASPELVRLKGKRFVSMNESNEYGRLDEERIKQLTGGESVSARALYQSAITFVPQFTLWLSCNDLPAVSDRSLFASDRIRLIEFNRHFKNSEQDKNLKDIFERNDSMSGIFMWLIRGYKKYLDAGLEMPEELKAPLLKYEKENDIVLTFIEERCELNEDATVRASALYTAYKNWATGAGLRPFSQKRFNAEIDKHPQWGVYRVMVHGNLHWKGIKFAEA